MQKYLPYPMAVDKGSGVVVAESVAIALAYIGQNVNPVDQKRVMMRI